MRVRRAAAVCAGLLAAGSALPHAQKRPPIRVESNLVNVLTSVLGADGRPILDLPVDSFEIYEDGVKQKIARFEPETNQPLDLALMIDTSLSAIKELKTESEAAAHFIRQVVRPGDALAVFEFDESVTQLSEFSADVPRLQEAVRRVTPGSGTAMYDAVVLGARELGQRPGDRRRVIVMVTDAGETTSDSTFEATRRAAIASEALIYTIVVRPIKSENGRNTAGEHALETIIESTGGAVFYLDSYQQLDAMFEQIDRELRTQYLLGYYPQPRPPAGNYRHIEVRVQGAAVLHYRKGYFAAAGTR
ncbi:MAG: VWA domain-containing protein [Candidatus Acidiferrales bacterium]